MPDVSIVIVGVAEWERYTLPFVESIQKYAPELHIVLVDNGSLYPTLDGVLTVKLPHVTSYPAALNAGMRARKADWYFLCNNDMLLEKPISPACFSLLAEDCLYSWIMVGPATVGFEYLESWSMFVPERIHAAIGEFDENFKPMWFEGADYCYRAVKAGFKMAPPLDRHEWGVRHFEDERDADRKAYMRAHIAERRANRRYLWLKHGLVY